MSFPDSSKLSCTLHPYYSGWSGGQPRARFRGQHAPANSVAVILEAVEYAGYVTSCRTCFAKLPRLRNIVLA